MFALKWFRVAFAAVFFIGIVALFLDFTQTIPTSWHWLAHLQLTPALLAGSMTVLVVWCVLTLLTGRIYCSAVCPFGILQDIFSRLARFSRGKGAGYRFRPEATKIRYAIVIVFLISLLLFPIGVTLLDPYGHFGRIAVSLVKPVYHACNNVLAATIGEIGVVRFHYVPIHVVPQAAFIALVALLLAGTLAVAFGRRYCNAICPVGTILGIVSRFSVFGIRLASSCVSCGLCEKACKGECIDSKAKTVDRSRCVACFNCLRTCRRGSIVYALPSVSFAAANEEPGENPQPKQFKKTGQPEPSEQSSENDRRGFLLWSALSFLIPSVLIPSIVGSTKSVRAASPPSDPSLPTGVSRVAYSLTHPVLLPGAQSRRHFQRRCMGCHLCVSKCPANVVKPSTLELGLSGFLQPIMTFDHGFCNFDCTICTEVCPSGALLPKTKEQKHRLQIGRVVFLQKNCVVKTQGSNCGACAEHCPTGAVAMVPFGPPEKHLTIPVVRPELCVGCGACEYICPVRPFRAIYVDGLGKHSEAELDYDPNAGQETVELEDFGF